MSVRTIDRYIEFQSTLPAWGSDLSAAAAIAAAAVSIHAPRVGERLTDGL